MEKLSYFCGSVSIPSVWQPCHVVEIYDFLVKRGYKFKLFKQVDSSNYLLSCDNKVAYYKSCVEFCNDFKELYFKEKEEEEKEYFRSRNLKAIKNNNLAKEVFIYAKSN